MKELSEKQLRKLVSEKNLSVTRGKKKKVKAPVKTVQDKPQNLDIAKVVVASAKTVLEIAEELRRAVKDMNQMAKSIAVIANNLKQIDPKVEVIKTDTEPKDCEYDIIRDASGRMTKVRKIYK